MRRSTLALVSLELPFSGLVDHLSLHSRHVCCSPHNVRIYPSAWLNRGCFRVYLTSTIKVSTTRDGFLARSPASFVRESLAKRFSPCPFVPAWVKPELAIWLQLLEKRRVPTMARQITPVRLPAVLKWITDAVVPRPSRASIQSILDITEEEIEPRTVSNELCGR